MAAHEDAVLRYLAEHDHFCSCGYNLRGLRSTRCPECGRTIDIPPDEAEIERRRTRELVAYLRTRDVYCKHCGYNLRGAPSNRCPECNASYMLAGVRPSPLPVHPAPLKPGERTRSRLILLGVAGSLELFAIMFLVASGITPMSPATAATVVLLVTPWIIALLWSVGMARIERASAARQRLLGGVAILLSLLALALPFILLF